MTDLDASPQSPSLRDRRLGVLRRTGIADKGRNRLAIEKPPPAFYWILVIVTSFILLGLVMVLSSSSVTSLHTGSSAWSMFGRQVVWVGFGLIAMWVTYRMPYDNWKNYFLLMLTTGVVLFMNIIVFINGQVTNGAKAWLDIGPFRLQPSEFMKVVTVLFCANLLSKRHRSVAIRSVVFYPMIVTLLITTGLCAAQRDFGSATIFAGIVIGMMFMASLPMRYIVGISGFVFVLGLGVLQFAQRASERMLAFLDLEGTKSDSGYQVYQALLSIANGGWSGTGIGSGTSKWGYVPLAYSDFIFSVIAEELGIAGTIMILGGFLLLVLLSVQVALSAPDMHGAFIAAGVATWFGVQAVVNIGGVVGVMPMTGLTLPFLSYGGSSMIASMAAVGLLLNVARYVKK
ncbi:MAG: cell division protein FtsW [Actinomycetota bacterium]